NGIGARIVSLLTGIPYILEVMHIPGVPKASGIKEKIYVWFFKIFIAFDTQSARAVRVINQKQTKDFMIQAGVSATKIKYIPAFYIDFDVFKPEFVEKKFDIIYVARLERNKGIINLLKAVHILRNKNQGLKVCLVGNGPLRSEIERFIKRYQLEGCVELVGWVKSSLDVARLLNQSRVFVNPSFNEGGPRVALEAMACGVPVITTRVGVMLDIIEDEKNGLFCDWDYTTMAQTIKHMLDDENLQQLCSHNAQETVQQFERKKAIKNYADELWVLIQ
ncbi:MAG: glycosyltransferase, partial [Patescibacteria group bacterium]